MWQVPIYVYLQVVIEKNNTFDQSLKRHCNKIFCFRFFSWITFPQAPHNNISIISNFFEIGGDICKSRCTTGVNDTGGKFAAGVNDAGGKLPLVSKTPVANNGKNIRLQTPESELEGKKLYTCFLYYPKVTKQNCFTIFLIEDFSICYRCCWHRWW
jgi:hypothetical protein